MTIFDDIARLLMISGILVLIIEVLVLGFSTFVLTFFGAALVSTALLMYAGLLDATWAIAFWANAILTPLYGLILWKPLKNLQSKTSNTEVNSDFASELEFILEADVDLKGLSTHRYSGVDWKLKSHTLISQGTHVRVIKKDVGVLWVEPVE